MSKVELLETTRVLEARLHTRGQFSHLYRNILARLT